EDGIRDLIVTGVQTCALPISCLPESSLRAGPPRTTRRFQPISEKRTCVCQNGAKTARFDDTFRKSARLHREHEVNEPAGADERRSEERRVGKERRSKGSRDD